MHYVKGGQPQQSLAPEAQLVAELGRSRLKKSGPISHQLWALDYIVAGDTLMEVGDKKWLRGPKTLHLYAPGKEYLEGPGDKPQVISRYVIFGPRDFPALSTIVEDDFQSFLDPGGIAGELLEKMVTLVELEGPPLAVHGLLAELLGHLLTAKTQEGQLLIVPFSDPLESEFVARVNQILQQDLEEKLTLRKLAAALHLSPSSLSHRYKEETGATPMQIRLQYRLKLAAELLRYRELTLEEIAHRCGFATSSHLWDAFRKAFGCPPSEFREKMWG